jgi:hypothetical protein
MVLDSDRLDGRGSIPGRGKIVLFSAALDRLWGHPASYTMGTGDLSPGLKRQGREAVKKGGAIPPLPHTFSWRVA